MEAAALFERVSRVSLPRLEFQIFLKAEAGYGVHAIALASPELQLDPTTVMVY